MQLHKRFALSKNLEEQTKHNLKKYKRKKEKQKPNEAKSESHLKFTKNRRFLGIVETKGAVGDCLSGKQYALACGDWNLRKRNMADDNEETPAEAPEETPGEPEETPVETPTETPVESAAEEDQEIFEGTEELIQQVQEEMKEVLQDNPEVRFFLRLFTRYVN